VGDICKSAICVELSAELNGVSVDRQTLRKYSGNDKDYNIAHNAMRNLLGISAKISPQDLCILFRCTNLAKPTNRLFENYKEKFLAGIPPQRRQYADFSRTVFIAVAFYYASKQAKMKIDKTLLINSSYTTSKEFQTVSKSMAELLGFEVEKEEEQTENNKNPDDKPKKKAPKSRKPKLNDARTLAKEIEEEDEHSDLEGAELDPDSEAPGLVKSKKRRKREAYEDWKGKVLTDDQIEQPEKKMKQATLNFSKKKESKQEIIDLED